MAVLGTKGPVPHWLSPNFAETAKSPQGRFGYAPGYAPTLGLPDIAPRTKSHGQFVSTVLNYHIVKLVMRRVMRQSSQWKP